MRLEYFFKIINYYFLPKGKNFFLLFLIINELFKNSTMIFLSFTLSLYL